MLVSNSFQGQLPTCIVAVQLIEVSDLEQQDIARVLLLDLLKLGHKQTSPVQHRVMVLVAHKTKGEEALPGLTAAPSPY